MLQSDLFRTDVRPAPTLPERAEAEHSDDLLRLDAETKGNRTTLLEDGLHVATIVCQGKRLFWWCVRSTGDHALSYQEAEGRIRAELQR